MNFECSKQAANELNSVPHELTHHECLSFLCKSDNKQAYDRFTKCMLNVIAIERRDFRKCPAQGCDYIGYIELRPSNDYLVCEKCDYKWEDPDLYPFFKWIYKGVKNFLSLNSDVLNNLNKIMSGEPCPS